MIGIILLILLGLEIVDYLYYQRLYNFIKGKRYFVGHMIPNTKVDNEEMSLLDQTREVIDNLALPGIIITESGIIQAFNHSAVTLFGYKLSQIIGRNVNKLMNGSDKKHHNSYLDRFIKTRVPRVVGKTRSVMGRNKSGELIPLTLAVSIREKDDQILFIGILIPSSLETSDEDLNIKEDLM